MYKYEHFTESIFYQLEQTAKYCRCLGVQIFEKINSSITVDEYIALDIIITHNGICQRELAKIILKDRANTGRILDSLEEKKLITRFVDTKNNRLVRKMVLTDEGVKIFKTISESLKDYIKTLPKVFKDEEKDNLKKSIIDFREAIEKNVEMKI